MRGSVTIAPVYTPATRWSLFVLTVGTVSLLLLMYLRTIGVNGYNWLEILSAVVFGWLVCWISFSFWCCTLGLARAFHRAEEDEEESAVDLPADTQPLQARTAILVPVYNECPRAVFARVQAMVESLLATGQHAGFEFFILSDTTDPEVWLQEELQWTRLMDENDWPVNVYYRRRQKNIQRKAGNIADFCTRWGMNYDFMIILDADSLMTGPTFVEMVRRMLADQRLAILQVPPRPINRNSLFARLQQFSATVYSPICIYGFDAWSAHQGNYWGHNAILRVQPFMQCCELPILPGKKPLGGEILSHDFVEAALLTGHGWKVQLAYDLEGSYEECPTTLIDYLIRDQRWCQGNMQHARLLLSEGYCTASRLHFLMGVMAFASSPIWLLFMLFSLTGYGYEKMTAVTAGEEIGPIALTLFVAVMSLLLLPKLWSLLALMQQPGRVKACGGWLAVTGGVLLETFCSILLAPVMAFYHSCFVFNTLLGRTVGWNSQRRDEADVTFVEAVRDHWTVFAAYLLAGITISLWLPELFVWFVPLLAGPLLIFPLAMAASSQKLGRALRSMRMLQIPEESTLPDVVKRAQQALAAQSIAGETSCLERLLQEQKFRGVHYKILQETRIEHSATIEEVALATELIDRGELANLPRDVSCSVLADRQATEQLAQHYRQVAAQKSPAATL